MGSAYWQQIARDCYLAPDTCNVYVLRYGDRALAVDFGTGAWMEQLGDIGVRVLEHVVITHVHRDQICGLYRRGPGGARIHVPAADAHWLDPASLQDFWRRYQTDGCPAAYAAPRLPVPDAEPDLAPDTETRIGPARFCAIATPGHTTGALSYVVAWHGRHLAFCGDAVHAGGTVHQPYHLEWDHWTASGSLAAWYGLERLGNCYYDWLLPAHGPPVSRRPRACVARAATRLLAFIRAKGSVCAGERNRWLDMDPMPCGAFRISPHLYQFGGNSFLLLSDRNAAMVIDPQLADLDSLEPLREALGVDRIAVGTASHYHLDHSDGLNALRRRYGAQVWLHPRVAEPVRDRDRYDLPWLPAESVIADRMLPEDGAFTWCEYELTSHNYPGQTRWHAAICGRVDGLRVLFSGDNYQPPTRWNGTGGFCAFNGSRFQTGFAVSASRALALHPDIVCNGHRCVYRFSRTHYRRILHWTKRAEAAVRNLCPGDSWLMQYDYHAVRFQPFVMRAAPGTTLVLELVVHNHAATALPVAAAVIAPAGWSVTPTEVEGTIPAGHQERWALQVRVPADAASGRHVLAADVSLHGQLAAERCVGLADIP